ncbi:hypothetical protein MNB_SUP05-5-1147 [hydrothermal vent metagenome]|uniref:Uncharacterized protein n=1 Tax=hydrothermal vent metagenome TaxID=652676 RepID=A0A1W1CVU2_9ZZZZ
MNETLTINLKLSNYHLILISLLTALTLMVIVIYTSTWSWLLILLVLILSYFSFKQAIENSPKKIFLKQRHSKVFLKNKTITTKYLTYTYLSRFFSVLKFNNQAIVIFKDSCEQFSDINLFVKTNAIN